MSKVIPKDIKQEKSIHLSGSEKWDSLGDNAKCLTYSLINKISNKIEALWFLFNSKVWWIIWIIANLKFQGNILKLSDKFIFHKNFADFINKILSRKQGRPQ